MSDSSVSRDVNDPKHLGRVYKVVCPRCDNTTRHEVVAAVHEVTNTEESIYWEDYEILSCRGCENLSFRANWQSSDELEYSDEDDHSHMTATDHPTLYPPRLAGRKRLRREHELPPPIHAIYHETHVALLNSQRILAGIGIRALIEAVCAEKGATGHNLQKRIDDLAVKGVLTIDSAKILHEARLLGNKAAHEVAAPSDSELEALMDIAEQLLMNVYVLPAIAAGLKRTPSRFKKTTP
jgi:hypothetical protein